jgi:hypothetical protein
MKQFTAMVLLMSLQDDRKQNMHRNVSKVARHDQKAVSVPHRQLGPALAGEAVDTRDPDERGDYIRWLRDVFPVVDGEVYTTFQDMLTAPQGVAGWPDVIDEDFVTDTVRRFAILMRAFGDRYALIHPEVEFWPPDCYPHAVPWRMREVLAKLLE